MKTAVFPGKFSPVTNGHLDIIERATQLFDKLYVAVVMDPPQYFTAAERVEMVKEATKDYPDVEVLPFSGLLVDFVKQREVDVIVRAIRDGADADFEKQLAQMNRKLTGVETLHLMVDPELSCLSSTLIREIGAGGRRLHGLVPEPIEEFVSKRLRES